MKIAARGKIDTHETIVPDSDLTATTTPTTTTPTTTMDERILNPVQDTVMRTVKENRDSFTTIVIRSLLYPLSKKVSYFNSDSITYSHGLSSNEAPCIGE
jgi:hypothetical protein